MKRSRTYCLLKLFCLGLPNLTEANALTFVEVGDPFNPSDSSGKGNVTYPFAISQTEISVTDYADFLNSVAKSDPNGLRSGREIRSGENGSYIYTVDALRQNQPIIVSIPQILRYINWLHNNKPVGAQTPSTTEDGAYTFFGGNSFTLRNAGATFWLPNENEWRKAAYYDPYTKTHFLYPTGNSVPTVAIGNNSGDVANPTPTTCIYGSTLWGTNTKSTFMNVGTSGGLSPWGTMDQGGNAWEVCEPTQPGAIDVRLLGGAHNSTEGSLRRTSTGANNVGSITYAAFRVAKASAGEDELDSDNDGIPNSIDLDDDNDGVSDLDELRLGTNPLLSNLSLFNNIKSNPSAFGLLTESELLNFETSGFTSKIEGNQIFLKADVLQSEHLMEWTEAGKFELIVPFNGPQRFYRLTISP